MLGKSQPPTWRKPPAGPGPLHLCFVGGPESLPWVSPNSRGSLRGVEQGMHAGSHLHKHLLCFKSSVTLWSRTSHNQERPHLLLFLDVSVVFLRNGYMPEWGHERQFIHHSLVLFNKKGPTAWPRLEILWGHVSGCWFPGRLGHSRPRFPSPHCLVWPSLGQRWK